MSDETTLLPCPWCGEYPKVAEDGGSTGPWFSVWHDCPPVEGGKARHYGESLGCISITTAWFHVEAEAIAAWNTRAELGSGTCAQCAKDMGAYADSLCDPLKERINELLRCLENDWHISASWDGLRKFWHIELTEEGVKLRDAAYGTLTADDVLNAVYKHGARWQAIADELNAELGKAVKR